MAGITPAGAQTASAIRNEAATLFFQHGFEATSLRQVAAGVGLKVGSLYNHIENKEDLLLQIMGGTMDELMELQIAGLAKTDDIIQKIIVLLECHIRFHAERARAVFIGNSELRSLSAENRVKITDRRREYQVLIEGLIEEARATGRADVLDARLHAFSIVAMGSHVASWYKESGPLSLDRIINIYSKIAIRGLGVENADELVDGVFAS
jgi:AcrR family transcriptional regulator